MSINGVWIEWFVVDCDGNIEIRERDSKPHRKCHGGTSLREMTCAALDGHRQKNFINNNKCENVLSCYRNKESHSIRIPTVYQII